MRRISVPNPENTSLAVQPAFLIGTFNPDGTPNFAPITWICASWNADHYLFVLNMDGDKQTKRNAARTGLLSANLVSCDMLELIDYFGATSGKDGGKDSLPYAWSDGLKLRVPTLDKSRLVYELEIEKVIPVCDRTTMYLCVPRNVQALASETLEALPFDDLMPYDPLVYAGGDSGGYHALKEHLGVIGDYYVEVMK